MSPVDATVVTLSESMTSLRIKTDTDTSQQYLLILTGNAGGSPVGYNINILYREQGDNRDRIPIVPVTATEVIVSLSV